MAAEKVAAAEAAASAELAAKEAEKKVRDDVVGHFIVSLRRGRFKV